jgi:ATP-dependent Clp protease protease subunit
MPPEPSPRKKRSSSLAERHLIRSRSVLLFGPIEPQLTREVLQQILLLDHLDGKKPIRVYINSPGGVADDGFAIYDVMRFVSAPVATIVTGLAASAATIALIGAQKKRRFILPHSRVMLHQPSVGIRGTASDIAISAREILRLRRKANELFEREIGQPMKKLEEDMHRDYWMSAQEAVDYGLCERVVERVSEIG